MQSSMQGESIGVSGASLCVTACFIHRDPQILE